MLCWASVTCHMVIWQVKEVHRRGVRAPSCWQANRSNLQCKWIIEGNLAVNVVTLTQLAVGPEAIHTENFTIPLAEFVRCPAAQVAQEADVWHMNKASLVLQGWLTLTVALAVAVCGRRWSYNLFHVTHHLVWIYLFVAIIHGKRVQCDSTSYHVSRRPRMPYVC